MKCVIDLVIDLMTSLSWVTENIRLDGFFMQVLASLTIWAISTLVVLLAWLGLVLNMSQYFSLEFISTMSETTLVSKFAVTS
jgi:hypothetical protein